jgi:hypothetical protein
VFGSREPWELRGARGGDRGRLADGQPRGRHGGSGVIPLRKDAHEETLFDARIE